MFYTKKASSLAMSWHDFLKDTKGPSAQITLLLHRVDGEILTLQTVL